MTNGNVRQRLLDFLEEHAFGPVMRARPEAYGSRDRALLGEAQDGVREFRERLQRCSTAEELYGTFERSLGSPEIHRLDRVLRDLGLPTLESVRIDLEQNAEALEVTGAGAGRIPEDLSEEAGSEVGLEADPEAARDIRPDHMA